MMNLANALQSHSAAQRWQAIEKLNQVPAPQIDAETTTLLLEALTDQHPFVRWQAGLALAGRVKGRQELANLLSDQAAPSPPELTLSVKRQQLAVIDALAQSGNDASVTALVSALQFGNNQLRQSAAEALAKLKAKEAVPDLLHALEDNNIWVRRAAVYALGHIGDLQATSALIETLQDQSVLVRRSAAYALGALRAENALPALKLLLNDLDQATRRNAAWALGRLGHPDVVPALAELVDDPSADESVKAAARDAIKVLTKPRWLQTLLGLGRSSIKLSL